MNPTLADPAQPPYSPSLGQGVCEIFARPAELEIRVKQLASLVKWMPALRA